MRHAFHACIAIALTAAIASAAASAAEGATPKTPAVVVADDHASWLVRDLWQFATADAVTVATPTSTSARGPTAPRVLLAVSFAPIDADAEDRSWLVRDLWQFTHVGDAAPN